MNASPAAMGADGFEFVNVESEAAGFGAKLTFVEVLLRALDRARIAGSRELVGSYHSDRPPVPLSSNARDSHETAASYVNSVDVLSIIILPYADTTFEEEVASIDAADEARVSAIRERYKRLITEAHKDDKAVTRYEGRQAIQDSNLVATRLRFRAILRLLSRSGLIDKKGRREVA